MSGFGFLGMDAAIEDIIRFIDAIEPIPAWHDWCIGITDDADRSLYEEHRAQHNTSIHVSVDSPETARSVKNFLIERYGMDGRPDTGEYPRTVFAFKRASDTDPPL